MTTYLHLTLGPSALSWLSLTLVLLFTSTGRTQTDLFISEYVESSSEKCIEIFNPTNTSINLDGVYRLTMGFNGGSLVTKSNLTGSIDPKQTHVVCTSTSSFPADQSMGAVGHNGNDAIVLEKNMSPIDIIGNIGCNPGTEWSASGLSTSGMTLVRSGCVSEGVDDPPDSPCSFPTLGLEWVGFSADVSHLGWHNYLSGTLTMTSTSPTSCGGSDGTIEIIAQGNGLEYSIDGSSGSFSTANTFNDLRAGTYDIVVRIIDEPDCFLSESFTLNEGPALSISDIHPTNPSDCGLNDGEIEIVAAGVNLEYSIDNGMNFQFESTFSGLPPRSYDIIIRVIDNNDCFASGNTTISALTDPVINSIHASPTTDCGVADGEMTIIASPSGLQYSMDNGTTWSANASFSNLGPGDYDIEVRKISAPSCRFSGNTTIEEPPLPDLLIDNITDAHCQGAASGSIMVSTSGGSGSYQYNWDGPVTVGNVSDPDNLPAGIYSVTVSDVLAPGCQDFLAGIQLSEPVSGPPTPVLDDLPQLCQLDAPYLLPLLQDGFDGTWSGPGISDGKTFDPTSLDGQINLTFTPDLDQCALSNSTAIMVDVPQIPILDILSSICSNQQVDLPTTQNGITGSWSGEGTFDNQFNPQGLSGSVTLTFNPDQGQCAESSQTSIEVMPAVTPTIQFISNLCENENPVTLLPNQAGISGHWSGPGVSSNIFNPLGLGGLITLHFEVNPDQCANDVFKQIEIFELVTPELDPLPTICEHASPIQLSSNQDQILGDWSGPGVTNNRFDPSGITGIVQLTFTPLSNQCGSVATQEILIATLPNITLNSIDPFCHGNSDGSIQTTISGGTAPYKVDWDTDAANDFDDEESLTGLSAGTYRIEVKDQFGCSDWELVELDDPASLELSTSVRHESSAGANDGGASAVVSGGTKPYQYLWNNGSTLPKIENAEPGIYSVSVTDDHGCSDSIQMIINSGNCAIMADVQLQHVSCFRYADGQAEVIVSNSLAPHSFQWSNKPLLDQPIATDLTAGDYMITITDAADCQQIVSFQITEPDTLVTLLMITPESKPGAGDASIDASTVGGTGPYTYSWSNNSSVGLLTDLAPGVYSVTTSDSHGCLSFSVAQISGITCDFEIELLPQPISCFDSLDGQIDVSHSGGAAPLDYHWSHDSTLMDSFAPFLGQGNYAVTVYDADGCFQHGMSNLSAPQPLSFEIKKSEPSSAELMDGQIMVSVSGGTLPYQWEWSNGDSTAIIANLDTGSYTLTVTDHNGCTQAGSVTLEVLDCDLVAELELDSVSCAGRNDGRASLNISSGVPPYNIQWSHDTSIHILSAEKLKAGDYSVTITAADGCVLVLPFVIKEPESLRIAFRAENETAIGAKDGYIAITAIGGTPPYFYNWNTGETADSVGNLKPGTYIITLTDAHGCQDVRSTMINPANCTLLSNVSVRPVVCFGESTGSARLDITTLAFPVKIRWSIDTTLRGNVLENLSAGLYSVTITDEDQCRHTWPFEVTEPDPLELEFEITHQSAPGIADGTVQTTVFGGSPGYTFQWSHGAKSDYLQNLDPGKYQVTVVDQKGCSLVDSLELLSSDVCLLEIAAEIKSSGCNAPSGIIQIQATNLRGNATYLWSIPDAGSTNQLDHLAPGEYWVEVKDDYCVARDTIQVDLGSIRAVSYNLKQSLCVEGATTLDIQAVTGGTAPYVFSVDGQIVDQNLSLPMTGGMHQLTVEDSEGCTFTEDFNVTDGDFLQVTNDTTIKRGQVLKLTATIEGNTNGLKYHWLSRAGVICDQCLEYEITPDESGLFTFVLVDPDGCRFDRSVRITVTQQNLIYIPNAFTPNGDDINDDFIIYDGLDLVEEIVSLEVYDRRGMLLYRGINLATNVEVPLLTDIMKQAIAPQAYMYLAHIRYKEGYEQRIKGDFIIIR